MAGCVLCEDFGDVGVGWGAKERERLDTGEMMKRRKGWQVQSHPGDKCGWPAPSNRQKTRKEWDEIDSSPEARADTDG